MGGEYGALIIAGGDVVSISIPESVPISRTLPKTNGCGNSGKSNMAIMWTDGTRKREYSE
jgi:hypothetical protein